jgi:hypothetical protein
LTSTDVSPIWKNLLPPSDLSPTSGSLNPSPFTVRRRQAKLRRFASSSYRMLLRSWFTSDFTSAWINERPARLVRDRSNVERFKRSEGSRIQKTYSSRTLTPGRRHVNPAVRSVPKKHQQQLRSEEFVGTVDLSPLSGNPVRDRWDRSTIDAPIKKRPVRWDT